MIDSSTHRLTGRLFDYRDLPTLALKGFAESVAAWQVLGEGVEESRFEALRVTTTPLVGRDEEIDLLLRRWQQAKRGEGCVVLIAGEPGIGKSRLAEALIEHIGAEPHTRLRYFCSPHHQNSALYPSLAQLERAAGFRREDSGEQRLAKLEALLARGTEELDEIVPLFADLLSVPTGGRYPLLFTGSGGFPRFWFAVILVAGRRSGFSPLEGSHFLMTRWRKGTGEGADAPSVRGRAGRARRASWRRGPPRDDRPRRPGARFWRFR